MKGFRYVEDAATLALDAEKCNGCKVCETVCPHGVLAVEDRKARIADFGACMECGACALNCEAGALSVRPGVGCAGGIIQGWWNGLRGKSDGSAACCG
ncbi:MAG TPA: mercury methylation ferredoxin HgcB [Coriobacteriia bacterium]|jgi:NAD-dependent dihydropyrimidine dehydrogenase PreA subunit